MMKIDKICRKWELLCQQEDCSFVKEKFYAVILLVLMFFSEEVRDTVTGQCLICDFNINPRNSYNLIKIESGYQVVNTPINGIFKSIIYVSIRILRLSVTVPILMLSKRLRKVLEEAFY